MKNNIISKNEEISEEEIEQTEFISLFFLFNAFMKYFQKLYKCFIKQCPANKLFFEHAWIIIMIHRFKKETITSLCETSNKKQSTISKAVDSLVKMEYVTKQRKGKEILLSLTKNGLKVFEHISSVFSLENQILKQKVSTEDIHHVKKLLEKIIKQLNIDF